MSGDNRLEPCPFCGKVPPLPKDFYECFTNEDCDEFAIFCLGGCGALGPTVSGEWDCDGPNEEAQFQTVLAEIVEAWNRRPSIPGDGQTVRLSQCRDDQSHYCPNCDRSGDDLLE